MRTKRKSRRVLVYDLTFPAKPGPRASKSDMMLWAQAV